MTTPRASLPSLRSFLGATACRKSTSVTVNRGLYTLIGGLTEHDTAVRDVVTAVVEEVDAIPDLAAPGAIGGTTPGQITGTLITGTSIVARPSGSAAQSTTTIANAKGTTTNATPTSISTLVATASSVVHIRARVIAIKSDTGAFFEQEILGTFKVSDGAEATEIGVSTTSTAKTDGTTAGLALSFTTLGSVIQLKVTGRNAETWRWGATVETTQRTIAE